MTSIPRVDAFHRLAPRGPKLCKICGAVSPVLGAIDFSKSCEDKESMVFAASGVAIDYNRCPTCGFVFSAAFDGWSKEDFLDKIYNDAYAAVDPHYLEYRSNANTAFLSNLFPAQKRELSVLDYGGGNGSLARMLCKGGFSSADTYDPLVAEFSIKPAKRYTLVCSFETLEHTPDPRAAIRDMAGLLDDPGIIVFSTLEQPDDFEAKGLGWWYASPRNGHISLFSRKSLELAWRMEGLRYGSFDRAMHVAFREIPDFARHLFPGP